MRGRSDLCHARPSKHFGESTEVKGLCTHAALVFPGCRPHLLAVEATFQQIVQQMAQGHTDYRVPAEC